MCHAFRQALSHAFGHALRHAFSHAFGHAFGHALGLNSALWASEVDIHWTSKGHGRCLLEN